MANNGHSDTHTLITSKIAAINARVSQNEDLIRRAEAAEVPASMDALLHRIEMFGRAKHDEGYYRDGDDLKSLNRERAAADLAEIRAMLAALKAQQPAPVDAEGLPPLPEPYIRIPNNGRGPMQVMEPFYSADQVRRAQREAVAAYVLKCQREARTAVETIRQGAKT